VSQGHILAIDDEPELLESIRKILVRQGYQVSCVASAEEGLLFLQRSEAPDLILTDLMMPGIGGMELLRSVKSKQLGIPVVLITAFATVETAVQAIKEGAFDYVPKPFSADQLRVVVDRALGMRRLRDENRRLRAQLGAHTEAEGHGIIGDSPPVRRLQALVQRVGPTPLGVLITGESGTGKEVVAQALHRLSTRCDKPFIPVDCAAIPASLMESELFGHERGAFTGAAALRKGLVEVADNGTFFLDEIGELDPPVQVKLLRLLQEGEYRRVGATRMQHADLRIVAATNRDLEAMVREGKFREDLFHRLNVVHIRLPPLRDRGDDIALLLQHFLKRYTAESGRDGLRFGADVVEALGEYRWPGNVRELVNCVRYMVGLSPGPVLGMNDMPPRIRDAVGRSMPRLSAPGDRAGPSHGLAGGLPVGIHYDLPYKKAKRLWLEVFEFAYISALLKSHDGNISHAARAAGIDRKSIQRLMKRNNMSFEELEDA
jgi:DNA-binding NtrC family response regulator